MALKPSWVAIVEDWGQENINMTSIYPVSFSQNNTNLIAVPFDFLKDTVLILQAITSAKKNNLKVALKPMVDVTNDPTHWFAFLRASRSLTCAQAR